MNKNNMKKSILTISFTLALSSSFCTLADTDCASVVSLGWNNSALMSNTLNIGNASSCSSYCIDHYALSESSGKTTVAECMQSISQYAAAYNYQVSQANAAGSISAPGNSGSYNPYFLGATNPSAGATNPSTEDTNTSTGAAETSTTDTTSQDNNTKQIKKKAPSNPIKWL